MALARLAPDVSRARVQRLIAEGLVRLGDRAARASARLRGGERIDLEVPPPEPSRLEAQDLPLSVLHEDGRILVLDKAAGMVVHPARGAPRSTVVNALLHRLRAGGRDEAVAPDSPLAGPLPRLGLVHRLDKDTSGC
ncbi:MAG TPA: RluA family pseudouridine synthase, partial [Anaeromyxobacteraceae bacterium]|nr:RluA family pseudouridine synthase [Anaeromyxobacteraceae bacterium]